MDWSGTAGLQGTEDQELLATVTARLSDDPTSAPKYAAGRIYGECELAGGDLMSQLPPDAIVDLVPTDGTSTVRVRVNSYDRGGSRAQIVQAP